MRIAMICALVGVSFAACDDGNDEAKFVGLPLGCQWGDSKPP